MATQFETDLSPDTREPRVRFNFDNGWSASLVVRTRVAGGDGSFNAMLASVAACPTGQWGTGATELGPTEAYANEAVAWISAVASRPPLDTQRKD